MLQGVFLASGQSAVGMGTDKIFMILIPFSILTWKKGEQVALLSSLVVKYNQALERLCLLAALVNDVNTHAA